MGRKILATMSVAIAAAAAGENYLQIHLAVRAIRVGISQLRCHVHWSPLAPESPTRWVHFDYRDALTQDI